MLLVGVSTFPFVGFAYENAGEPVPYLRVAVYALLTAAIAVGTCALVLVLRPGAERDRVAAAVAIVVFSFFSFAWWLEPQPQDHERIVQLVIWSVVTAGFAALVYRLAPAEGVRTFLLIAAVALVVVPSLGIVADAVAIEDPIRIGDIDTSPLRPVGDEKPNIYHFVLDGHDRHDVITELMRGDGGQFVADLREREFQVATEAVSSYPITALSLGSTLSMDYVATEPTHVSGGLDPFFEAVRGDNGVVRRLRESGYEFVYSPNGTFNGFDCSTDLADVCIEPRTTGLTVGDLEYQLLELTPIGSLDLAQLPFTDPIHALDELDAVDPQAPFYLLAHVISPHPPYRFQDDCTRRSKVLYRTDVREKEAPYYLTDVECVDALLLGAVDRIIAEDPSAIIVVQSDHGSELLTNWYLPLEQWTDAALVERYAVLDAMRLPERCDGMLRDDEALVNTFRVVFACIEGTPVDRLPYQPYLFRWGDEDDLVPIPPERITNGLP